MLSSQKSLIVTDEDDRQDKFEWRKYEMNEFTAFESLVTLG